MCSSSSDQPAADIFATTRWTVVVTAGLSNTEASKVALEDLCRTYWIPIYVYIRRRGYARDDAKDLTQAFFCRFLEKDYLSQVSSERGRFRAFLLAAVKHFLANEWDKARREKRGGHVTHLSLDWHTADEEFQVAETNEATPDQAYDRQWAVTLLARVIEQLRSEALNDDKVVQFSRLEEFLTSGRGETSYAEAAQKLGWQATAVRVAVHRLRKRYRQLLRKEIASTLANPADVDQELEALFGAFQARSDHL